MGGTLNDWPEPVYCYCHCGQEIVLMPSSTTTSLAVDRNSVGKGETRFIETHHSLHYLNCPTYREHP